MDAGERVFSCKIPSELGIRSSPKHYVVDLTDYLMWLCNPVE